MNSSVFYNASPWSEYVAQKDRAVLTPNAPRPLSPHFWGHIAQASISAIISIYAFCCLVTYAARRKCFTGIDATSIGRNLSRAGNAFCILSAFMAIASNAGSFLELLTTNSHYFGLEDLQNQSTCNAIFPAWFMLCGTTCVYLFLWTRQRVFYVDPLLKEIAGNLLQSISFIVLILWIGYFAYGSYILGTRVRLIYIDGIGCQLPITAVPIAWQYFLSWVIACSIMQACLLALFVYPLLKRRGSSAAFQRRSKSLNRRVVRATCLTSLCIFTDIIAYLSFYVFSGGTFPIYNINLALNVITIILCYDFWDHILIPCCSWIPQKVPLSGDSVRESSSANTRFSSA